MLCVRSLTKTYRSSFLKRQRTCVLHDVGFEAREGRIVGLVGPNGAGKTTILHALAGLTRCDRGEMVLGGEPLTAARAHREVALCSSADRSFYYRLTLRQNLQFFGSLYGLHDNALRRRIDAALDATDLHGFADRRYSRCSTGVRQRLTFARALLSDARVYLLDEPTRAVDPVHAQLMHRFIRSGLCERRGAIVVLATNVLEEAWTLCDTVVLLAGGRIIGADTPAALGERFSHRITRVPVPDELFAAEAAR